MVFTTSYSVSRIAYWCSRSIFVSAAIVFLYCHLPSEPDTIHNYCNCLTDMPTKEEAVKEIVLENLKEEQLEKNRIRLAKLGKTHDKKE